MLTVSNISKIYGDRELFKDISFTLYKGEKSAIIGNNGSGKTTILNIITGKLSPDSGSVFIEQNKTIGYLPQDATLSPFFSKETSSFNGTTTGISQLDLLHTIICINPEITLSLNELQKYRNTDITQNNDLATKYAEALANFTAYGGYSLLEKGKKILKILGFSEKEFTQEIHTLSGGQKTRALLGKLLISDCDCLLLDEPTNHLDFEAQELFVNYLKNEYKGALLIVSHDRYFINQIVDNIYELSNETLTHYHGIYDDYLNQKTQKELTDLRFIEKNKKIINKLEESVQTLFSHRNFSARDSMVKKLNAIKDIQSKYSNKSNNKGMKISISPESHSGKTVLKFNNISNNLFPL